MTDHAILAHVPKDLLVNGRWAPAENQATFPVENPANGEVLCDIADASSVDALAALDAAVDAQESWRLVAPRERAEILRRAYEKIVEQVDDLALLMTLEMGKTLAESRAEVLYAVGFLRWFAEEATRIDGGYAVNETGTGRVIVMRQPVGPCLLITPWNFPLAMGTRKIGPAIAAGCTMIVKPAQQTPLSMLMLGKIFASVGLPAGVLNIVTTTAAAKTVTPLLHDQRLRKLSFTGSTTVGQKLIAASAEAVLRVSMELGGNAPFIVFEDADLDEAVQGAMVAKLRNIGEACTAANRFLVAEPFAEIFAQRLAEKMAALQLGPGDQPGVDIGPLIDIDAANSVAELVEDAVGCGATILTGGKQVGERKTFFQPTVLTNVPSKARVFQEEIFGPVAPITAFSSEAEAIELANSSEYGLAAYLYTRDIGRAIRVSEQLDAGMIGLNQGIVSNPSAPFGGIKASGFGREGGREGILEYLETKYVAVPA